MQRAARRSAGRPPAQPVGPATWGPVWVLLVLVLALALVQTNNCQPPQSVPITQLAPGDPLQAIQRHQAALASECARFEALKVRQLRRLVQLNGAPAKIHLPDPLPVELPAVCLYLFGPPHLGRRRASTEPQTAPAQVELLNWIYEPSELAGELGPESLGPNVTSKLAELAIIKRQASSLDEAKDELQQQAQPNGAALADFLLNIHQTPAASMVANESNQLISDKEKFHLQMDRLIGDRRFQQAINSSRSKLTSYLSPVVLVPGLLGSRLQARVVSKTKRANIFCSKQSAWQDIWLSLRMFFPVAVDCWLDNARLEPDPISGWTKQPAGVEARVPDFGSIESVRHLDLRSPKLTKYYSQLIERYEQLGYTPDLNLFAAPYDFRLAPEQLFGTYFKDLRRLIEAAHSRSSLGAPMSGQLMKSKVTLVCHSMGCTHLLIFLRQQSPAWRQNRIRKVIALSSPWAGTTKALKALLVGDQLDLPLISAIKMRKLARNYPSIAYLLPQREIFEQPNKRMAEFGGPILVETPQKIYNIHQLKDLFNELGLQNQWRWFESASSLIKPLEPLPDVSIDCIHSRNIPTPETLIFRNQSDFPDGAYELVNGDGDGTVNEQSLEVCATWARQLPDKVKHIVIMNTNHLGVLSHPTTLTHITDDVLTDGTL